jgi:hypothetical protein
LHPDLAASRAEQVDEYASAFVLLSLACGVQGLTQVPRTNASPGQLRVERVVQFAGKHLVAFTRHRTIPNPESLIPNRIPNPEPRTASHEQRTANHEPRTTNRESRLDSPSIFLVDAATPDVSSTGIRKRLAAGEPITGLVPAAVERHIVQHGLYTEGAGPLAADHLHGED